MIQAAIDGMVTSLDPHSGYLAPDDYSDMEDQTRGSYGGLGLEVSQEDGAVKIIAPIDDTPAAKAGLQSGDYITSIDGKSLIGLPLSDAVKKMRGTIGEPITLTIVRPGKDPFDVRLVREAINVKSAKGHMEGDYGYLRVSAFDEKTTDEAVAAIKALQAQNPHMKGMVLDLRNNPGGLFDQAVGISSLFLDGGEVVSQRGRDPKDIERYYARSNGDILHGLPMVVLINSGTASAAEIVSGALQDRHRAAIVGLTSFGKGSVQTVIPLNNGADGALKLTTARYFTPSGRSIQKTGIEPDLEVAATDGTGAAGGERRVRVLRGQLLQRAERRRGQGAPRSALAGRGAAAGLRSEEGLPAPARARRLEVRLRRSHAEAAGAAAEARLHPLRPRAAGRGQEDDAAKTACHRPADILGFLTMAPDLQGRRDRAARRACSRMVETQGHVLQTATANPRQDAGAEARRGEARARLRHRQAGPGRGRGRGAGDDRRRDRAARRRRPARRCALRAHRAFRARRAAAAARLARGAQPRPGRPAGRHHRRAAALRRRAAAGRQRASR